MPDLTIDQQLLLDAARELLGALEALLAASAYDSVHEDVGTCLALIEARVRAKDAIARARGHWPNEAQA